MKKLCLEWTKHLERKSKEADDFEDYIRNSSALLLRMRDIIEHQEQTIFLNEATEGDYSNKEWAYLQAHRNGKKEAFRIIKKLTEHLE